jgi:hypothetical protein
MPWDRYLALSLRDRVELAQAIEEIIEAAGGAVDRPKSIRKLR